MRCPACRNGPIHREISHPNRVNGQVMILSWPFRIMVATARVAAECRSANLVVRLSALIKRRLRDRRRRPAPHRPDRQDRSQHTGSRARRTPRYCQAQSALMQRLFAAAMAIMVLVSLLTQFFGIREFDEIFIALRRNAAFEAAAAMRGRIPVHEVVHRIQHLAQDRRARSVIEIDVGPR